MTRSTNNKKSKEQYTGRVITRFGEEVLVSEPNKFHEAPIRCTPKRKFDTIVCGDHVTWQTNDNGNASIIAVSDRKNALTRNGFRGKSRSIAANIDQVIIVSSWLPEPDWHLLDRYLIATEKLHCKSVIVINKDDLKSDNAQLSSHEETLEVYKELGYTVILTDAHSGKGMNQLKETLAGKTSILAGRSGVGKSSIANQILPNAKIEVGDISMYGEGKHTTTTAWLYKINNDNNKTGHDNKINNDAFLIDSPGVRDFVLDDIDQASLAYGYIEFRELLSDCKFNNCTHKHEPQCAIKSAVESKIIHTQRYERYLSLLKQMDV